MSDPFNSALRVSASGLHAQSIRMRIAAENLANSQVTGAAPGADPYRRKTVSFAEALDEAGEASAVEVSRIGTDRRAFRTEHRPGHPAADGQGIVKLPNVDPLIEMADMREAQRNYLANIHMLRHVREAISSTIDLLRNS